jgi:membrane-associated phospholipid phosphatase
MKLIFPCRSAFALLGILFLTTASLAQHIILPAQFNSQSTAQTATLPIAEPASQIKTDSAKPSTASNVLQTATETYQGNFFAHILREQKTIWTRPFNLKGGDAKWLVPLAVTTAVLFATDKDANKNFTKRQGVLDASSQISRFGEGYTTFAFAGLAYTLGKFTRNERMQETGKLGIEALINTSIAVGGLKYALGRKRPSAANDGGNFFRGGQAFPSGHSATCWALAAVVAEEYMDKPWIRFGAYAMASAVSVSRFTGQKHFPSDVFIGSAIGYLIGHYTVKAHGTKRKKNLIPTISPTINQATKTYGLSANVSF